MKRIGETGGEAGEVRFGWEEWIGAVVSLGVVLAGAAGALGLVYWIVVRR